MSWIAYVGSFEFPEGQASSQRVLGVSKAIAAAGYNIQIGSGSQPSESDGSPFWSNGQDQIQFWGTADHIKYHQKGLQKLSYLLRTGGRKTVEWLKQRAEADKPKAVIYYGTNSSFIKNIHRWCRQNGVPFIVDVVEWYDPRHLGGKFSILNLENKHALKRLIPKADGVIAISTYLEKYYRNAGVCTVRVPILIDLNASPRALTDYSSPIKLVYAGNSGGGKKDLINIVIPEVAKRSKSVHLTLLGIDKKGYERLACVQEDSSLKNASNIEVLGRVTRDEVFDQLAEAHFVPLLREDAIYSRAGFPTKMVEAMVSSTPLIANLTGDMGLFVIDGESGVVCESPNQFDSALDKAESLSTEEYAQMAMAARNRVEELSFELYGEKMEAFLDLLIQNEH